MLRRTIRSQYDAQVFIYHIYECLKSHNLFVSDGTASHLRTATSVHSIGQSHLKGSNKWLHISETITLYMQLLKTQFAGFTLVGDAGVT